MSIIYEVTRRDFLRTTGIGAGAVVFGLGFPSKASAQDEPKQSIFNALLHGFNVPDIPFVALKLNGDVVIVTHRAEMGQGIRTSLAMVLADEMEADWKRVELRQADADSYKYGIRFPFDVPPDTALPRPYDKLKRDNPNKPPYLIDGEVAQFTDSSRSMTAYYTVMRLFGAGLRLVMERAAAAKWGLQPSEVTARVKARQHRVYLDGSDRSYDYRSLLLRSKKVDVPTYEEILAALKKEEQWNFIGKDSGPKDTPFYDVKDMVTGKTEYGADIRMRGMLTAMIERCPVANGDVAEPFDDSEARKVPGVVDVIKVRIPGPLGAGGVGTAFVPHAGVAVLATNTWAAWEGRRKLRPHLKWDTSSKIASENAKYDSVEYRRTLDTSSRKPSPVVVRHKGDVDAAFQAAGDRLIEECYYVPHLAQAPMEPPVAVALFENDRLEVWAPTQNPDSAQRLAGCVAFNEPVENWELEETKRAMRKKVTLHLPIIGGGFGRKSKPDYILEAAYLARRKPGVPIRVQWTREDDIQFSFYNAVSCQYLKAGLDANDRPTSLLWRSAFPSIFATLFPPPKRFGFDVAQDDMWVKRREEYFGGGTYPYASAIERAQGLEDLPFNAVENIRIENSAADNYIRVGWMRSVANVYHAFAICSFADELAKNAGEDPVKYLLDMIGPGRKIESAEFLAQGVSHFANNELPAEMINVPVKGGQTLPIVPGFPPDTRRLRAVIERVAEESGWKNKWGKLPERRGIGIAAHRSFLTYVALVFDVSLGPRNELTINEAHAAIDCGLAVNVDRVRAQVEGGINYGLSMALLGEITAKNGRVVQSNFDDYPVLRINQVPKKIFTYLVRPSEEVLKDYGGQPAPTGVGEPPTPVVAPALANAIVAAGGPRIREMPFRNKIVVL